MSPITKDKPRPSGTGEVLAAFANRNLESALAISRHYQKVARLHPALREVSVQAFQLPMQMMPIEADAVVAGTRKYTMIGFSPEDGGLGYYCQSGSISEEMTKPENVHLKDETEAAITFWEKEGTAQQARQSFPDWVAKLLPSDNWGGGYEAAFPLYRVAGITFNYSRMLPLGLPGLEAQVREEAKKGKAEPEFYEGLLLSLDTLRQVFLRYADDAKAQAENAVQERKADLQDLERVLRHIAFKKPETLHQAVQFAYLFNLTGGAINYGRMDIALAPFMEADLARGIKEEAMIQVLASWYRQIERNTNYFNGRIILGGLGRPNASSADRFAVLAIKALRVSRGVVPQISVRMTPDMDPQLKAISLQAIGEGLTFPMLYNDLVNIPSFSKAMKISESEAVDYVPYGCGEYVVDHKSIAPPNAVINLAKTLEYTIHGGRCILSGQKSPFPGRQLEDFSSFEELYSSYLSNVSTLSKAYAVAADLIYKQLAKTCPFHFMTLGFDGALERGKSVLRGGIDRLGHTVETYGNTDVANDLTAIKKLVFDEKTLDAKRYREAIEANFEGYKREHNLAKAAPKFGNDDPAADILARRHHGDVCAIIRDSKEGTALFSNLVVMINNEANTMLGRQTAASAEGRKAGMPLAPGNNPTAGTDVNGPTAFLNSLASLDTSIHAGAVQNMKFTPDMFKRNLSNWSAMLQTYFERGGSQAMVTVVNVTDLEGALKTPENYPNLLVRVGGFSARFIELHPEVQREIISRTSHG